MTETCCVCEKEYIVCTHNRCGNDEGRGFAFTHKDCDEWGCGECMNGCDHSPWDEYCMPCAIQVSNDAAADRYTRRAEDGFRE